MGGKRNPEFLFFNEILKTIKPISYGPSTSSLSLFTESTGCLNGSKYSCFKFLFYITYFVCMIHSFQISYRYDLNIENVSLL